MAVPAAVGAASVASGIVLGGWTIAGVRPRRMAKARVDLPLDMRTAQLERSVGTRVVKPSVAALADRGRKLTPAGTMASLERRIAQSGAGATWPLERVLAAKVVLGVFGAVLGLLLLAGRPGSLSLLGLFGFTASGWFVPDVLLYNESIKRQELVQKELADALDQITITVEAGLGFEAAVDRFAQSGDSPLKQEFARMLREVRVGASRQQALESFVMRTNVTDVRKFAHAVAQSDVYGIPIAQVLRAQSDDLRDKRKQRAEEKAQKVPVKILMPLVLCILPALFIVVLGPAAMRLSHSLGG